MAGDADAVSSIADATFRAIRTGISKPFKVLGSGAAQF